MPPKLSSHLYLYFFKKIIFLIYSSKFPIYLSFGLIGDQQYSFTEIKPWDMGRDEKSILQYRIMLELDFLHFVQIWGATATSDPMLAMSWVTGGGSMTF